MEQVAIIFTQKSLSSEDVSKIVCSKLAKICIKTVLFLDKDNNQTCLLTHPAIADL